MRKNDVAGHEKVENRRRERIIDVANNE